MLVVRWRGRELRSPVLRALATPPAILLGLVGIVVAAASFPLHLVLRAAGRQGFLHRPGRGPPRYMISAKAFRRRQ